MEYIIAGILGLILAILTILMFATETEDFPKAVKNKETKRYFADEYKKHLGLIIALPIFESITMLFESPFIFQIVAWLLAIIVDKIVVERYKKIFQNQK